MKRDGETRIVVKRRRDEVLVQRQEDEEYLTVCLILLFVSKSDKVWWKIRGWRGVIGLEERRNDYGGGMDRGQKARRKRTKDQD